MIHIIFYFTAILVELLFVIGFSIYTIFLIYSNIKGSPYVPTKSKELDEILRKAKIKAGQIFIELGSGDGRACRKASDQFKAKAVGIDVNPLLILYSRFLSRVNASKNVTFIKQNMFDSDLSQADFVYLFLMPEILKKLAIKMDKDLKKNVVVISHGFKIEGWEDKLYDTLTHLPFPTYYYKNQA